MLEAGPPVGHSAPRQRPTAAPLPDAPRITPITPRGDEGIALFFARTPLDFWRATDGLPDPASPQAPPSILQIRISLMLATLLEDGTVPDESTEAPVQPSTPFPHPAVAVAPDDAPRLALSA